MSKNKYQLYFLIIVGVFAVWAILGHYVLPPATTEFIGPSLKLDMWNDNRESEINIEAVPFGNLICLQKFADDSWFGWPLPYMERDCGDRIYYPIPLILDLLIPAVALGLIIYLIRKQKPTSSNVRI